MSRNSYDVGKVWMNPEIFLNEPMTQEKLIALFDLTAITARLIMSYEGKTIRENNDTVLISEKNKSLDMAQRFLQKPLTEGDLYHLIKSWEIFFGQNSVIPSHLDGCVLEGDPSSYDVGVFNHILGNNDPQSIIDVGCGSGQPLSYFDNQNIELTGIDGSPIALFHAKIKFPNISFYNHDFTKGTLNTERYFDIGLSIEFLEHVKEEYQENYMNLFKRCKKCYVTFAPPGMPGYHHVNCRTEEYWIEVFASHGFKFLKEETDIIRNRASAGYFKGYGLVFENVRLVNNV